MLDLCRAAVERKHERVSCACCAHQSRQPHSKPNRGRNDDNPPVVAHACTLDPQPPVHGECLRVARARGGKARRHPRRARTDHLQPPEQGLGTEGREGVAALEVGCFDVGCFDAATAGPTAVASGPLVASDRSLDPIEAGSSLTGALITNAQPLTAQSRALVLVANGSWIEDTAEHFPSVHRALADGPQAFVDLDSGASAAPKIVLRP